MFFPFHSTMMLGLESGNVIGLRMLKLTRGGSDALNEMHLMIGEKVNAAFESSANLMAGASADSVEACRGDIAPALGLGLAAT